MAQQKLKDGNGALPRRAKRDGPPPAISASDRYRDDYFLSHPAPFRSS